MKVLLVYSSEYPEAFITRAKKILRSYFGESAEVSLTNKPKEASASFDAVIYTEKEFKDKAHKKAKYSNNKTYILESTCSLNPLYDLEFSKNDESGSHIFNRLAPKKTRQFYYFPFGYLYRHISMGKTNEFGHRINADLNALKNRDKSHIVIAIFGGSGAASFYCLYEEMFSNLLQNRLNKEYKDKTFNVLNFSQPGAVLINQINHYLLFCEALNPEIVIAHDGLTT